MNTLVLNPGRINTAYSLVSDGIESGIKGRTGPLFSPEDAAAALEHIRNTVTDRTGIDILAIRAVYGGDIFQGPVFFNSRTMKELSDLSEVSPLYIPAVTALAAAGRIVFPGIPAILVFETSFSGSLPPWEYNYAIDPEFAARNGIRRFCFHGIMHEEAARFAAIQAGGILEKCRPPLHVFSLCLEPKPEAAALIGKRPVMTTGGATPVEGLPGETACGDIDAGILIRMAQDLNWGPEEINNILTGESGMAALTGKKKRLDEIFKNPDIKFKRAKKIFLYRLLLAAGSAAAAMDGIDCIVFSGRYRNCGRAIGKWLLKKLKFLENPSGIICMELQRSLEEVIAGKAAALYRQGKTAAQKSYQQVR